MFVDLYLKTVDVNGTVFPIEMIYFPMGEIHCRFPQCVSEYADVQCRIRNSEDIMTLLLAVDALKSKQIKLRNLYVPYLPYSRQDRIAISGEPHSLKVISGLLDSLGFAKIFTLDVHSNVAEACFRNTRFVNLKPIRLVQKWLENIANPEDITLVSPDEGAIKRTFEYMQLGFKEMVSCFKTRDPKTGAISGFKIYDKITTKEALVLDDICDGGGTFLGLAPLLKEAGAEKLFLWVTHGGFTKGIDKLLAEYNEIGCTNSYSILDDSILNTKRVTQLSIQHI
jgi:ribose-phosphate pyrophosphokinase